MESRENSITSETAATQQLFQSIDYLAKTLRKLVANLTSTTNSISSVARI